MAISCTGLQYNSYFSWKLTGLSLRQSWEMNWCQEQDRLSLLPLRWKNPYLLQIVKRSIQQGWISSYVWLEWLGLNRIPEVHVVNSGKSRDFVIQNLCSCLLRKATRDGLVLHRWESQGSLYFEVTIIIVLVGTSIFLLSLTLQSCSENRASCEVSNSITTEGPVPLQDFLNIANSLKIYSYKHTFFFFFHLAWW